MNSDGGYPYISTTGSHISPDFGFRLVSQLGSFVNGSPENLVIQEVSSCISKLAGAVFYWLSTGSGSKSKSHGISNPRCGNSCAKVKNVTSFRHFLAGVSHISGLKLDTSGPVLFAKIAASSARQFIKELVQQHSYPLLSLAAALVPPIDNLSSSALVLPLENSQGQMSQLVGQAPCDDGSRGCPSVSLSSLNWTRDTVEPSTGIKFPLFLENPLPGGNFQQISEILVGTGSRTMKIVRVKSLRPYAFGLYVQPDSVCEKLELKYAYVPTSELKERTDFFEDLLWADIHMTVRLVVNCNGIKISAVKEAIEKSLRTRLKKINPDADYHCLSVFGSYFTRDIPLPVGTAIDFRKTSDGHLITEIGGRHIGAVQSKDLCRAFFDMYIGEGPVSVKAKHEVAESVANLIRRC